MQLYRFRAIAYCAVDIAFILLAWTGAYLVYGYRLPGAPPPFFTTAGFIVLPAVYIIPFIAGKIYQVLWEKSYVKDVYRLLLANAAGSALFVAASLAMPATLPLTLAVLTALFASGSTVLYRMIIRDFLPRFSPGGIPSGGYFTIGQIPRERKILIIGAGEAGRLVLSEYHRKGIDRHIAGFVDDDSSKIGRILNGKMVFGATAKLPQVIRDRGINEAIIAFPSAPRGEVNRVIGLIQRAAPALPVKILPPYTRIFENPLSPDLREIGITDILDREELTLDTASMEKNFAGTTVLVTGAGGSIGSELCKQLLKFRVKKLIALGRGEHSIYTLIRALTDYLAFQQEKPEIDYRVADVRDAAMMDRIFGELQPQTVFHAAAHKHVPLMEFNEAEAVRNNVGGTRNVLEAASRHGAERFVLVSTDKAVRPANVMGATKRAAEIMALECFRGGALKTSIVRFGNVIGSRGSVIPLFREQIERGGPVTVTHPEVTRFFMSIPEAALLVINAAAYSSGGEIFVLDMGRQYRVLDVAKSLIRLHGLEPERDIEIKITGLRPGEKMYEELSYGEGELTATGNRKILMLKKEPSGQNRAAIDKFVAGMATMHTLSPVEVRQALRDLVPEYSFDAGELSWRDTGRLAT
jgi:FlaA1/EpsC-like NDP-sugar epimerase